MDQNSTSKSDNNTEKSTRKILKEKGQLSIFLGITVSVIITMLAFIINVGLFVKAKINLQNAVDAGAWSGAAVQARQLTNIAYMNWELRNTMKEWMFKYYVLGQMGLTKLRMSALPASGLMDFTLKIFDPANSPADSDVYNLPTTCIHFGSPNNICEIYNIPGIPRFPTVGLPGISERHESFLNSIRDIKSKDCSTRSIINQGTSVLWAYGTGSNIFPDAPEVGADRIGAWPEAIEIAFRIRNLEAMVNRPAISDGMCRDQSGATSCDNTLTTLQQQFTNPINERPIKALMGAYRNLGGGIFKRVGGEDEFTTSFVLKEISPNVQSEAAPDSLSGLLIPADRTIADVPALRKTYLDLQVFPVNYVTYFTSFFQKQDNLAGVVAEGACYGTKTALPVPGYITGFSKNHEVMTYYAVKGEADFMGLFFPFAGNGIKLHAYAAAKPFGGRIGPKLFGVESGTAVIPRADDGMSRSAPFITGVQPPANFVHGAILPANSTPAFWAKNLGDRIGGNPTAGNLVFGVPNLTYDFASGGFGDLSTQIGSAAVGIVGSGVTPDPLGLYDARQYNLFKANLFDVPAGGVLSATDISTSIEGARRPTRWDALNYLIPTPKRGSNNEGLDSQPVVNILSNNGVDKYHLFAPLYDANGELLYTNEDDIIQQVNNFILSNAQAIDTYTAALEAAAQEVQNQGTAVVGGSGYTDAYQSIHPLSPINLASIGGSTCTSMAEKFFFFFNGANASQAPACDITPLQELLRNYFAPGGTGSGQQIYGSNGFPFETWYESSYALGPATGSLATASPTNRELHTAYVPGPRTGAEDDGQFIRPVDSVNLGLLKRNFYSTKLIAISKVVQGGDASFGQGNTPIYQETDQLGYNAVPAEINASNNFLNRLLPSDLSEFGDAASLDF